jgi:hypothetical protein
MSLAAFVLVANLSALKVHFFLSFFTHDLISHLLWIVDYIARDNLGGFSTST